MEKQLELKRKKRPAGVPVFRRFFVILMITLIFLILFVFFAGRTIADVASEEVGVSFYEYLNKNGLSFFADLFFGDRYVSLDSELTATVASSSDGISVLFPTDYSSAEDGGILALSPADVSGKLIAVKNPLRFSLGRSTQQSNTLSTLMSLSGAYAIFSSGKTETDSPLITNGDWIGENETENYTYLGFTADGILEFGAAGKNALLEKELKWAMEQDVHTLISGGVPQGFELSDLPLRAPSVSIGQCADGSILLLFLDEDASCKDAMEVFYKYNAVNAALIYIGEDAAFLTGDTDLGSYVAGETAEDAHYHSAWIFR